MRKRIFLCVILILIMVLTACSNTTDSDSSTNNVDSQYSDVPPQPITLESLDDAVLLVKNHEYSKYAKNSEERYVAYKNMADRFMKDGYLTLATHNTASRISAYKTVLYPEVKYEDMGICYWFQQDDQKYQVLIYTQTENPECALDLKTSSLLDYYLKKSGRIGSDIETVSIEHDLIKTLTVQSWGTGDFSVMTLLDETHYLYVRAIYTQTTDDSKVVTVTELAEFVEGLTFSKIALK